MQEPSEPDALALALFADPVHAVVPVACTHERKPVPAHGEARIERPRAMLEQSRAFSRNRRHEEATSRSASSGGASRKGTISSSTRVSLVVSMYWAMHRPAMHDRRKYGSVPLTVMRQPPMLHVAFGKLAGGTRSRCSRPGRAGQRRGPCNPEIGHENHRRRGLIEGRAGPHAAGEGLVEQPAIDQKVHRAVGRLDLDRAQNFIPGARDVRFQGVEIGSANSEDRGAGVLARCGLSQEEHDFGRSSLAPVPAWRALLRTDPGRPNLVGQRRRTRQRGRISRASDYGLGTHDDRPSSCTGRPACRQKRPANRKAHSRGCVRNSRLSSHRSRFRQMREWPISMRRAPTRHRRSR